MYSPPSSVFATINSSQSLKDLEGNVSLVMRHPALWGYYICDDCCKGFDFLWQLAYVYDVIKRLDPYHLTAGFAECGELHAFQEPWLSLDVRGAARYQCP